MWEFLEKYKLITLAVITVVNIVVLLLYISHHKTIQSENSSVDHLTSHLVSLETQINTANSLVLREVNQLRKEMAVYHITEIITPQVNEKNTEDGMKKYLSSELKELDNIEEQDSKND